ncbi:ABC transporter substrate-binding protein [Paenibacillus sp. DMB20]|uniref:ABC transporter substrate-binding protein n=1 Tax=Paenibacillus sp. DMB20 TaxID=1642570 RepID=UPI000627F06E|nr:ABC transporter substrate-binding protein [Paenibacillus sp. DMB20]KKO54215.1 ABC transporter substrate-binding protein [Paenibacillus sp. DMB20]
MLIHKRKMMLVMLLILAFALAACGNNGQKTAESNTGDTAAGTKAEEPSAEVPFAGNKQSASQFPRTIQHVKGELTLENAPQKIASVDIMATDYLLVLDIAPVVSEGFSTKDRSPIFGQYAKGKEVVDLGGKTNLETLLEMEPDLIVMSSTSTNKVERFDEFNKMADSVVIDFSLDAPSRLRKFAELVGKEEKAEEVIAYFNQLKEEARTVAAKHNNETVLFLISNGKDFTVIHPTNFPIFYEEIGLTPVPGLPEEGKIGGRIGIEALSEFAPDHIFIAENRRQMDPANPQGLINIWTENAVWNNLEAVKNNQVYSVDTLVGDTFFLGQVAGLKAIKEHLGRE